MAKNQQNNLMIVAIIAIVAIVALLMTHARASGAAIGTGSGIRTTSPGTSSDPNCFKTSERASTIDGSGLCGYTCSKLGGWTIKYDSC